MVVIEPSRSHGKDSAKDIGVAALTVDGSTMQEHAVQKISHRLTAYATLETGRVTGDVEVLDGDLCVVAHHLSTICTWRLRG